MRYFFIIISLTLLQFVVKSQTKAIITATVITNDNYIVNICEPINGYHNINNIETKEIDNVPLSKSNTHIKKEIFIEKPSVISIIFLNAKASEFINRCELLLMPGDSVNIEFNLQIDNPKWAKYTGSNAEGHKLFNKINYVPIEKYSEIFKMSDQFIKDKNENLFLRNIVNVVNTYANQFDSLFKKNLITKRYKYFMDLNFTLLLYEDVCNKLTRFSKANGRIPKMRRKYIIEKLFEKLSPLNDDIKGLFLSELYTSTYYQYEACKEANVEYVDELTEVDKTINIEGKELLVNKYLIPYTYIKDKKAKADFWALNMLGIFSCYRGVLDESAITQYSEIFPNNKWEKYLRIQYEKFKKKENVVYKLQSPITFIDSTQKASDLNELLKLLPKNKPVFIDMWATWCGPCKDAFSYNQQLDSLLITSNFEKLYISIDNEENVGNWRRDIDKYKLGGYHYLANEKLKNSIKKITDTEKDFGMRVPRYMIVNRYGVIVNIDATSPSYFEVLKNQLSDYSN